MAGHLLSTEAIMSMAKILGSGSPRGRSSLAWSSLTKGRPALYLGDVSTLVQNVYEAKTRLSALVERAARGEEIIIAKDGVPMARLVPLERSRAARRPGGWRGKVWMAPDFDASLEAHFSSGPVEPPRAKATRRPVKKKRA